MSDQTIGAPRLSVRVMRSYEFAEMRAVLVRAFGDDESIGVLVDALHDSWAWIDDLAFVAELGDRIVGAVLYTSSLLDAPPRLVDVLTLSPLGVDPSMHGQGIGTALVTESLAAVRAMGRHEAAVFLEGSPFYYPRFGFGPGRDAGFDQPSPRTPDAAFQVVLLDRHEPWMTGRLVYPDAFWRTDSVGLRPAAD